MTIRVVVCDDQSLVRAGLRLVLESEGDIEVAGEATTGLEAIEACRRARPDVVLMDIRMPELDGIEATRRLLALEELHEATRVLVLTNFALDEYVFDALRAGASGFVLKDAPETIVEAVRVLARGDSLLTPEVTRRVIDAFVARPAQVQAVVRAT